METTEEIPQRLMDVFVGVSHGDAEKVREMLRERPGLVHARARWGETPIEAAAQVANREIMETLLAAGAPLDICTAAALRMDSKVKEMIEADPGLLDATGAHGIPLLHYPAVTGNRELAEWLLAQGVEVNVGSGNNTALHGVAYFGGAEMAEWLIAHDADPNATDYEGKTPLARAVGAGNEAVAEVIRRHGGHE